MRKRISSAIIVSILSLAAEGGVFSDTRVAQKMEAKSQNVKSSGKKRMLQVTKSSDNGIDDLKHVPLKKRKSLLFAAHRRNDTLTMPVRNVPVIVPQETPFLPPPRQKDTLTFFSSAYLEDLYTNEGIAAFGEEITRLGSRMENIGGGLFLVRWGVRGLTLWSSRAFYGDNCGMGMALRARALGCEYMLGHDDANNKEFSKNENFFKSFFKSLIKLESPLCILPFQQEALKTSTASASFAHASTSFYQAGAIGSGDMSSPTRYIIPAAGESLISQLMRSFNISNIPESEIPDDLGDYLTQQITNMTSEQAKRIVDSVDPTMQGEMSSLLSAVGNDQQVLNNTVDEAAKEMDTKIKEEERVLSTLSLTSPEAVAKQRKITRLRKNTDDAKKPETKAKLAQLAKTAGNAIKALNGFSLSFKEKFILFVGGMNQGIYCAERLSERIYANQDVTFAEGSNYFLSYLFAAGYTGKKFNFARCLKQLDLPIKDKEYKYVNYMGLLVVPSVLLNPTTYYTLYSTGKAMLGFHPYVAPWEPFGFRMPDIFFYLTTKGESIKVNSGYRINENIRLIFGIEHVLGLIRKFGLKHIGRFSEKIGGLMDERSAVRILGFERMFYGKLAREFHLGLEHRLSESWNKMSYKIVGTFGEGGCGEASLNIPISDYLGVTFGGATYASESLLGERHTRDLAKKRCESAFVSFSIRY
ncbi:MAG: hypothetical protein LBH38_02190 [Holosporales bacterium]|jgi:hypothetical protein|nr:hypothetical protein [Holosporales bacterium]